MTKQKTFKRHIRDRMSKTGESYTAARKQAERKRARNQSARQQLSATDDRPSSPAVTKATGKSLDEWFGILDDWGAASKKHADIARFLSHDHGVDGWWSQSVTVSYERARGLRLKHQGPDGFAISSSKTVGVPIGVLFNAVVDPAERRKWLSDGSMRVRTTQLNKSARFDWEDGATRVIVGFTDKGESKSTVAIQHEKLRDADEALTSKELWKERLAALKHFVES